MQARAVEAEEISSQQWVDVCELVHGKEDPPLGWAYGFKARDGGNPRRLDRIHVPWGLTLHVGGVFTSVVTCSHHKVLCIERIAELGTMHRWRFPEDLLKDEEFVRQLGLNWPRSQGKGSNGGDRTNKFYAMRCGPGMEASAPVQQIVRECTLHSFLARGWHHLREKGLRPQNVRSAYW